MAKPRSAIFSLLVVLPFLWPVSSARAEQAFQRFLPLLIDLDGWQGKKPDGMSMEMPNASMTTATRDYQHGSAQVHASVMVGQSAAGALAPIQSGMNLTTTEGHMITATMHGMQVLKTFTTAQKSGALMVVGGKVRLAPRRQVEGGCRLAPMGPANSPAGQEKAAEAA